MNVTFLHGVHRGYCVYVHETGGNIMKMLNISNTQQVGSIISGLKPFTKYFVQVAARTTPGCGVKSEKLTAQTLEDSK